MDILDEELLRLWELLHLNHVKYIMVGGFATNLHGYQRTTGDLDIWIEDTKENREALRLTLKELEIGDFPSIETVEFIPGWSSIILNSGFELDIMTFIMGFDQKDFSNSYEIAPTALIHKIPVKFLHLNQLIEAKKLLGRSKDLIDVDELEKIKNNSVE